MCQQISEIRRAIAAFGSEFDACLLSGSQAQSVVRDTAAIESIAANIKALASARAHETNVWQGSGHRSASEALSRQTGIPVGSAKNAIDTGKRLASQPDLSRAALTGELSAAQTSLIAGAAEVDPNSASRLIEVAGRSSLAELKDEVARTKAAAIDIEARHRAIRAKRRLRAWTDPEGGWHLAGYGNPEDGAQIMAAITPGRDQLFRRARREGTREHPDAYTFDALVQLAKEITSDDGSGPIVDRPAAAPPSPSLSSPGPGPTTGGAQPGGDRTFHPGDAGTTPTAGDARTAGDPTAPTAGDPTAPTAGDPTAAPPPATPPPPPPATPALAPALHPLHLTCSPPPLPTHPDQSTAGSLPVGSPPASGTTRRGTAPAAGSLPTAADPVRYSAPPAGNPSHRRDPGSATERDRPPPTTPGRSDSSPPPGPDLNSKGRRRRRPRRGAPVKLLLRVDYDTWVRGFALAGETCELAGYGPIPVSVARDLCATGDPFVAAILTKGKALVGVAHLGRSPTAFQQNALEWLYPTSAAEGCTVKARLERDHEIDWSLTHFTMLDHLDLLCHHHHRLKTVDNWALVAGRGKRAFVSPQDPRHPRRGARPAHKMRRTGAMSPTG